MEPGSWLALLSAGVEGRKFRRASFTACVLAAFAVPAFRFGALYFLLRARKLSAATVCVCVCVGKSINGTINVGLN